MAFRAGSLEEPDDRPGLAWFLGRRHRSRHDDAQRAVDIAEALDDRGVALRVATNRHVLTLSCTCLAEDFRRGSRGRRRRGAQPGVSRRGDREAARGDDHRDSPGSRQPGRPRQRSAADTALWRAHPVRPSGEGKRREPSSASPAPIWSRTTAPAFAPGALSIAIVGDVRAAEAARSVADRRSTTGRQRRRRIGPCRRSPRHTTRQETAIEMADKSQSGHRLRLHQHQPAGSHATAVTG